MSHFVPVSSASLSFISRRLPICAAAARVTSGACTRSCNPWKIINTRSLRLLSFSLFLSLSLSFDSRCQRSARVRSVWCVINDHAEPQGVLFRYSSASPTQACLNTLLICYNAISFSGIFWLSSWGGMSLLMAWRLRAARSDTFISFFFSFVIVDGWREPEEYACVIFYQYIAYFYKKCNMFRKCILNQIL